jgi:hypothetical protein
MKVYRRNSTSESEGKPEHKFNTANGTIFRISKCFQRSKQKLELHFSVLQARLKVLKTSAHFQKVPI